MPDYANELSQVTAELERVRWQMNQAEERATSVELRLEGSQDDLAVMTARAEAESLRAERVEAKLEAVEKVLDQWVDKEKMLSAVDGWLRVNPQLTCQSMRAELEAALKGE